MIATYDKSYICVQLWYCKLPQRNIYKPSKKKKFEIQYIWFAVYLLTAPHKTTPHVPPHTFSQAH